MKIQNRRIEQKIPHTDTALTWPPAPLARM